MEFNSKLPEARMSSVTEGASRNDYKIKTAIMDLEILWSTIVNKFREINPEGNDQITDSERKMIILLGETKFEIGEITLRLKAN